MLQPCPKLLRNAILYLVFLHSCSAQPSYYIMAPRSLHRGINTTLAVHWFGNSSIDVTAEIRNESQQLVYTHKVFTRDCIDMLTFPAIPEDSASLFYSLILSGKRENQTFFTVETPVFLKSQRSTIFIELDKSFYKPGQGVKFRAVCLQHDLKPLHGEIDINVLDAANNLVQQWLAVIPHFGVFSEEFILADNPQYGVWTIEVLSNGNHAAKHFTVSDYSLPPFEVKVETPPVYIMSKRSNITGVITAKYIYGKPVIGDVTVTVEISSPYYGFVTYVKTYEISGMLNLSFTYEEFDFLNTLSYNPEWLHLTNINIKATVKESATGIEVNGTGVLILANSDYRILDNAGPFKPYLNYTVKVKIVRSDLQPLTEEERGKYVSVQIIQSAYEHIWRQWNEDLIIYEAPSQPPDTVDTHQHVLHETGIINIQFPVLASTTVITMQVKYQNTNRTIQTRRGYWQMADAYVQIHMPEPFLQVDSPFLLNVESNENPEEINYVVLSKGQVVAAGKQKTTGFTLTPQSSWAPEAMVRVYYIHSTGEIISASRNITVKQDFKNKVSLTWSNSQVKPSEIVSLNINVTEPGSLVGLMIVEKTANLNSDENKITEQMVANELKMYTQESTASVFTDAVERSYEMGTDSNWMDIPVKPQRSGIHFPEIWIWQDYNISSGESTILQMTVPDSATSWEATAFVLSENLGLGLTRTPAELQVTQTCVISLNLPSSVTRGEQFILEVILFNHLNRTLEVTTTLELKDSFDLIAVSNVNAVANQRRASVPSQSGSMVLFPIRPKQLGEITFTIKANSSEAITDITKKVLVKAEGIPKTYSQAVLLDATSLSSQIVSKELSFTFPTDVVNGSEQAYITVVGDILGPSIDGLESLIQMPYGCGEQNMINFCPNIYVLQYLKTTGQMTQSMKEKAIGYMIEGYQTELSYMRSDGSFSAFGNSDPSGSTWLSAFVLRCFLQARPFIYIDQTVLQNTAMWLIQYQNAHTGEFSEPGHVIHVELQGGQNGPTTLTAYILTALLEDEGFRRKYKVHVSKALTFIENKFVEGISSNYTLAVVTYALSLANSTKARLALDQLNGKADRANDAMFWSSPAAGLANYWQPRSSEIETSAYALLACSQQNRINEGIPIMKWLSQQRSQLGGYTSTQDTIMALQALSQFAALLTSSSTALNVSVTGASILGPIFFQINSANLLLVQSSKIEVFQPLSVNVSATGIGRAVVQLNVMYNINATPRRTRDTDTTDTFRLDIEVKDEINDLNRINVGVCTSYIPSVYGNQSGMALMEVQYLSGFSLDQTKSVQNNLVRKVEPQDGKVNLYFDTIGEAPVCVSIPMLRDAKVSCTQGATISIVDYYKPRTRVTRLYSSKVMKAISACAFCGENCASCTSNVPVKADRKTSGGHSISAAALSSRLALLSFLALVPFVDINI
ncbi:CD109 antigen-like [Ambystoma mexicanum]|uniref:CD109 antigen-like n=1 Tax=Ambystoma mexicanum TaxID=8296 RepID=UPI0037E6FA1B